LETDRKWDKWLTGKALIRKAREAAHIHYVQLGKLDVWNHLSYLARGPWLQPELQSDTRLPS
jgi:hypothetical protein